LFRLLRMLLTNTQPPDRDHPLLIGITKSQHQHPAELQTLLWVGWTGSWHSLQFSRRT
jgi:hypothetical protein